MPRDTEPGCATKECITKYHGVKAGSPNGKSLYAEGYVYCGNCGRFMKEHSKYYFCLCCKDKVRTKPAKARNLYDKGIIQVARH